MLSMSVRKLVEKSYDIIGPLYDKHRDVHKIDNELENFYGQLPKEPKVLDAGCGAGRPVSKFLTDKGVNVMGIDISDKMLKLAKQNVPDGNFQKGDMTKIKFGEEHFDGVVSVFALFHIEKQMHEQVFSEFFRVLKRRGVLMINTGIRESDSVSRFFGQPMVWSNHKPEKTLELVKKQGFEVDFEGVLQRGGELQYWIMARKPLQT